MGTPTSTQLQIASSNAFDNILVDKTVSYSTTVELNESDFSGGTAPRGVSLYSRVRHSADTGTSAWSNVVSFTIRAMWSGGSIPASTPVQCNSYNSNSISTTLVSSDKVLVCYYNISNSSYLYAQILTISGTTITASTPVQCNSYSSHPISTTLVSSDKVLVCYSNDSNNYYLYAQILTISGTTITASTPVQCNSYNSQYVSTTLVSSDKVLVCYRNDSNSYYLYAQIITG